MEKGALVLIALVAIGLLGVVGLIFATPSSGQNNEDQIDLQANDVAQNGGEVQVVQITATGRGYDPSVVRVKAGQPVELRVTADNTAGCSRAFVMRAFGIKFLAQSGKNQTARFTPKAGTYDYTCSMGMYRGKLIAE